MWEDEREIECPKHGSTFSLDDRRAADAARDPAGAVYDVQVDGDDVIGRCVAVSVLKITDLHATVAGQRDPARRRPRGALGRGARAMGPNGSGKSTLSHVLMGRGDYDGHRRLGHHRRRGAARPAHVAARAARACSSRCSTRSRCPACALERPRRRARSAAGAATPTVCTTRVVAEAAPPRRARRAPRARRQRRVLRRRAEARRDGAARGARAEVRGPRRDRLRPRRRRAARRRPPGRGHDHRGRPRRARDHALRASARRAAPRRRARAHGRAASCRPAAPSSPQQLEETGYEGLAAELGIETAVEVAAAATIPSPIPLGF